MTYNVRNIAIALVLAGIAAFLVIMYTGNVQKQAKDSQQATSVLVATANIAAGTSVADAISGGKIQARSVVQQDVIVGALKDEKSLNSSYVTKQDLYSGQQVTSDMFSPSDQTGVANQIKQNYRAIQFAIDSNSILGGTLQAGDHVDLVGTYTVHPASGQGTDFDVSRIIVADVLVLKAPAADSATGGLTATNAKPPVILSLPDTVIPKVTFTLHHGDGALWLVLRPASGSLNGPITLATVKSVIFDGLNARQIQEAFGYPKGVGK
ncbi:MAG: pilus assembly protein CpaB [Gaiellales bacterium]|jgi:Flp pilus assembly protein CpaB|nr:pilus assembly protein CpaB [Gaiellales bacterium]